MNGCTLIVARDDLNLDALEHEGGDDPLQRVTFDFRRFDVRGYPET